MRQAFAQFWDHYLYDISQFILEICRQAHIVYLIALILALTVLRKQIANAIFALPNLIRELRDAGLRQLAGAVIESNAPAAKEQRLENYQATSAARVTVSDTLRISIDEMARKAIMRVVESFPPGSGRGLCFDVALNMAGIKRYADGFIRNYPDASTDVFFEVKFLSATKVPNWTAEMQRYSDFLCAYSQSFRRKARGFLVVIIKEDSGDVTRAMIDAVIDTPEIIDVKFVLEHDIKK